MKYFQAMLSKYGFLGGEDVPSSAEGCRDAYVQAINFVAASRGSKVRVRTFNRPGVHNWCLIEFTTLDGEPITISGDDAVGYFIQDPMADAIRICRGLYLEQYLTVDMGIDWSKLNEALMTL